MTIICNECGKLLRDEDGHDIADIADIHTAIDGEDVCVGCCDVCSAEEAAGSYVPFQSAPKHELLPDWQRDDYIGD